MATDTLAPLRIEPRPEFAKILRIEEPFAAGEEGGAANRINGRFDRLVTQSGTGQAPSVILRLCLLGAIALGGAVFVCWEDLLLTAIGAATGALFPFGGLFVLRSRRRAAIDAQMPALVQALTQLARGGRSLPDCLQEAAAESASPLRNEIDRLTRRVEMGIGLDAALEDLAKRTGSARMSAFAAGLAINHRSGGDLVRALDRLER